MSTEKLQKDIEQMKADIAAIRTAIAGDEFGTTGIAGRLQIQEKNQTDLSDRISKLETERRKLLAYIIGGAGSASAGISGLINLFF